MQTFLPYPDLFESLSALDNRRLGKQRVEALQVLRALEREHYGWKHHPCVRMWAGYCDALKAYYNIAVALWVARGFKNSMPFLYPANPVPPPWLGDPRLHASHRANLLRKDAEFYGRYEWTEEPLTGYWWPAGHSR